MRATQLARATALGAATTCAAGCGGPSLDRAGSPSPVVATFEPPVDARELPSVFRARLKAGAERGEPWLLAGELSDYFERALRQGEVPEALEARALPLRFWRDGLDWLVQPLAPLEPGAQYSLALRGWGQVAPLRASPHASPPVARFFPLPGRAKHRFSLVCGLAPPDNPAALLLEPGAIPLQLSPGAPGSPAEGCIGLHVEAPLAEPVVAPPLLGVDVLEPSAFLPDAPPASPESSACPRGQVAFGACLEARDDRLLVTHDADALWLVSQPRATRVAAVAHVPTLLLRGLAPASELVLVAEVITGAGQVAPVELRLTTLPARPHVLLNEVLANAAGPEPASEWIEIVNDAERPVSLAGLWLEDGSGHVALPPAELAPGEFALLVGPGFQASGLDVPVPASTRLIELPSLGERGLSNSGEALLLVGPSGITSRFPPLAAAHAGRSLARRTLDAVDDQALSFCEHASPGASPGAPNSCD